MLIRKFVLLMDFRFSLVLFHMIIRLSKDFLLDIRRLFVIVRVVIGIKCSFSTKLHLFTKILSLLIYSLWLKLVLMIFLTNWSVLDNRRVSLHCRIWVFCRKSNFEHIVINPFKQQLDKIYFYIYQFLFSN